jgi:hypothetical protein
MVFILKFVILFFACGIAMVLVKRLENTSKKLGELHEDLRRNEARLAQHQRSVEQLLAEKAAEAQGKIKS